MKEKKERQKAKFEKFMRQQKEIDSREERDKDETNLLFDKLGNRFKRLPSLGPKTEDKQ
jgi:hypothetical protein